MSVIEVSTKPGFGDPAASGVLALARELGLPVEKAETSALYRVEGKLSSAELDRLAAELLADPVTQTYVVDPPPFLPPHLLGDGKAGSRAVIDVWLKPQVADPVAPSIERGARDLGFSIKARQGARYRLVGRFDQTAAESLAWKALANPVVHVCEIHAL